MLPFWNTSYYWEEKGKIWCKYSHASILIILAGFDHATSCYKTQWEPFQLKHITPASSSPWCHEEFLVVRDVPRGECLLCWKRAILPHRPSPPSYSIQITKPKGVLWLIEWVGVMPWQYNSVSAADCSWFAFDCLQSYPSIAKGKKW